jgi:peptidoglycan/xylan/chitin deacetylase (PgdA/CDA1 family)
MLTFLKGVLFAGLFALFLAAGFYGFRGYLDTHRDGGVFASGLDFFLKQDRGERASPSGGRPRGGNLDAIVKDYERKTQLAKAGDGAPTAGMDAAVGAAPGTVVVNAPKPTDKDVVIREWPTQRKWVALTFDDGPHPNYTRKFIDLLQSKNAKATFFLIGRQANAFPGLVKELADAGFELANHSWSHPQLTRISPEKVREELANTSRAIAEASGAEVGLLRPPYGSTNAKVQAVAAELGLRIINWSIDTNDWRPNATADSMTSEILKNVRDGSIILMHDRHEKSLITTERVIDKLRAEGYEFVTVSELLGLREPGAPPARPEVAQAPAASVSGPAGDVPAAAGTLPPTAEHSPLPAPAAPTPAVSPAVTGEPVPATSTYGGDILPAISAEKLSVPAPSH